MPVIATAGHVDHGKSSLVKALTGQEPDRWEEERRRGLTIDLGFVWTTLASGADLAFVDVPGHERFLSNMLAGVGPAPAVLFVVAADEGWQSQSQDHLDAITAFGMRHAVIALTKRDRVAPTRLAEVRADVARRLRATSLADAPIVAVSARTGEGLDDLRAHLDTLLASLPAADPQARVRLWVDRAFSVTGAGTVVTGTLTAGTIRVGDHLRLGDRDVQVRTIESEGHRVDTIAPISRVALNLKNVAAAEISRGEVLITDDAWQITDVVDVRRHSGDRKATVPRHLVAYLGTAEIPVTYRGLGDDHARLTFDRPLPVTIGDCFVLRRPGDHQVLAGVEVVDADPPALTRRGDGARRARAVADLPNLRQEILRREAMRIADLRRLGYDVPAQPPSGIIVFSDWWVYAPSILAWRDHLLELVDSHHAAHPLTPGLSEGAAHGALNLPGAELFGLVVAAAKLERVDGIVRRPGVTVDLGEAEAGIRELERRLKDAPFAAPEAQELAELGLGPRELAAAERAGRIRRVGENIVVLPAAIRQAATALAQLPQPFTASEARQAWTTTRRVAIPLLEYLDVQGITRRIDGQRRIVLSAPGGPPARSRTS